MRRVLNIEMPCSASGLPALWRYQKFFLPLRRQFFLPERNIGILFCLTYELEEYYATTQNPCYYHTYSVAIKEFFRLATSLGVTEPEAITIDTLIEYWNTYCKSCKSLARRQNAVCAMTALMKYLHRRGDVPECYQRVLFGENVEYCLDETF